MSASPAPLSEGRPFAVIFAALALVLFSVGGLRLWGYAPATVVPGDAVVQTRHLHVEDAPSGAVTVTDAESGAPIVTYNMGEGSFFRATLRTLVHDRLHKGLGMEGNFRLEAHQGSQLFLIDEVSGKALSLNAFGPANAAVFAALMSNPSKGESQ